MTSHLANTPLSDDEYEALDELLGAPALDGRAMDVSMLEGFLAAVAMGPNMVMPSQWLPWVWDRELGIGGMAPVSIDDVNRANGLVMRHYNHMATWLREDPASFEPIFECGPPWGAAEWCEGFLVGLRLDKMGWAPLMIGHMDLFAPLNGLAAQLAAAPGTGASPLDAGAAIGKAAATEEEIDEWTVAVAPSVVKINALLTAQRRKQAAGKGDAGQRPTVREVPKVGRNDPCHCGSGKKFKKCCGAE